MAINVEVGSIFYVNLSLPTEEKSSESYTNPGNIIMEDLNTDSLNIISTRWIHGVDKKNLPYLQLKIKALKEGECEIIYATELDSMNPLFIERKKSIHIFNKNTDTDSDTDSDTEIINNLEIITEKTEQSQKKWWFF